MKTDTLCCNLSWAFLHLLFILLLICCSCIPAISSRPVLFQDSETALYGYRSPDGEIVIPPRYNTAQAFSDHGIAAVADSRGWQYINTAGKEIVRPFIYDN